MTLISMTRVNIEKKFQHLSCHILDQEPLNNHLLQLIKLIFNFYITLCLQHINSSWSLGICVVWYKRLIRWPLKTGSPIVP